MICSLMQWSQLLPVKIPMKESDPRQMGPNFYYNQEDYLRERVAHGAKWTWTANRPNPVCGFATGNPMNLVLSIGVYAAMCKEMNLPFRFPGGHKAYYDTITEVSILTRTNFRHLIALAYFLFI